MTVVAESFDSSCWRWLTFLVAQKIGNSLLYALSLAFLSFSIYTLHHRARTSHIGTTHFWLVCSYVLLLLGTTQIVLNYTDLAMSLKILEGVLGQEPAPAQAQQCVVAPWITHPQGSSEAVYEAQWIVFAVNLVFADLIFIYRCYLMWENNLKITLLPCTLLLGTLISAALDAQERTESPIVPLLFGVATNVLLVGLCGWRVRMAKRDTATRQLQSRYGTVLSVIAESGALYVLTALVVLVTRSASASASASASPQDGAGPGQPASAVYYFALGAAVHTVNIVPTIAMVRTGLAGGLVYTYTHWQRPYAYPLGKLELELRPGLAQRRHESRGFAIEPEPEPGC
ncbi:hypothetical protein HMN09_00927300 [Mycena chlorophos]|uniref:Uncharacterized protein n=1 Tax=Mycena chlorophos TaxID=658473 RepID=A0A8H6W2D4_MYCCL|nr:hypothetical protein HMN09_00927300 [Mycena chlorophos]